MCLQICDCAAIGLIYFKTYGMFLIAEMNFLLSDAKRAFEYCL